MKATTTELTKAVEPLKTAIDLYQNSLSGGIEIQRAFRDAAIQRFEYSLELAWKVTMKMLGSQTLAAKPAIREMARNNLIDNPELWIEFIEHRNNTSHSYNEDVAKAVFLATEKFFIEVTKLLQKLGQIE